MSSTRPPASSCTPFAWAASLMDSPTFPMPVATAWDTTGSTDSGAARTVVATRSERHPTALLDGIRPYDNFYPSIVSSYRLESPGDCCGKLLQSVFSARASFPEINIDSGYRSWEAVRLKDGNKIDRIIVDFKRRHADQGISYGFLNF